MQDRIAKIIAAASIVGVLGVGSIQLANAQDDPTTSTTVEESTDTTAEESTDATVDDSSDDSTSDAAAADEDCPKDGAGDRPSSDDSSTTGADSAVSGS